MTGIGYVEGPKRDELYHLILQCAELKEREKFIKKNAKESVDVLKTKLHERGLTSVQADDITATLSEVTKTTINEDLLIGILTNLAKDTHDDGAAKSIRACIEYNPSINEDKVQKLLYQGILSAEDIAPALEETTTERLNIKVKKGDK